MPQRSTLLFQKSETTVPGAAGQHDPQPLDGARLRLGRKRVSEGGVLPASRAVQLPGTISFVRKAIIGDRHRVNKLTGENAALEESREHVDKADGDQQGEPADKSS